MQTKPPNLFEYSSYLDWLEAISQSQKAKRGYHKLMSDAAGCQPSFLSQVFRSKTHLTPDQAAGLCEFWMFNAEETEYFISLVHRERSGSKKYRSFLTGKIEALRDANSTVSRRIQHGGKIELEFQAKYYADWYWAVIHIMTSVPKFQDPKCIAAALGLGNDLVLNTLKELRAMKLVAQDDGRWRIGINQIHLDRASPFNKINQKNYRQFALNRLSQDKSEDLHFGAIYGLSKKAYIEIREMLLNLIAAANKEVLESKEEQAACIVMDLISL